MRCPECPIDPELHAEIAVALADLAPTISESDDMARSALIHEPPSGGRLRRWLAPVLAAATLLAIGSAWWVMRPAQPDRAAEVGQREEPGPAVPPAMGDIEDQRRVNDAALVRVGSGDIPAREGEWAVIAAGKLIGTAKKLPEILAKADRLAPGALHRYVFRIGHEHDVTYQSLFERQMVGLAFLRQVGLNFWENRSSGEGLFRVEDGRLCLTIETGWPGRDAPARSVSIDVVTGFSGPLLLTAERMDPRFEMPGSAVLRIGNGMKTYSRYVMAVRVGEETHYVETLIGGSPAPDPATAKSPEAPILQFTWVKIPAGRVRHGSPRNSKEVALDGFEIMKYEVTNQQWWDYLWDEQNRLRRTVKFNQSVPRHWGWDAHAGEFEFPQVPNGLHDLPVVNVTWYQANDFCTVYLPKKLKCGPAYLPTSAQWEMAARGAGSARRYPWGDEVRNERGGVYVYMCNVRETGMRSPVAVTRFPMDESPFGVRGMGGNVSEFVGFAPRNQMAYKGGSFEDPVIDAQVHIETAIPPNSTFAWSNVGFRAVRDAGK